MPAWWTIRVSYLFSILPAPHNPVWFSKSLVVGRRYRVVEFRFAEELRNLIWPGPQAMLYRISPTLRERLRIEEGQIPLEVMEDLLEGSLVHKICEAGERLLVDGEDGDGVSLAEAVTLVGAELREKVGFLSLW